MAARIRAAMLACALVAIAGMSAQARPLQQTTGVDVHGLGGTGAKAAATGIGRQTDHRQVRVGRHGAAGADGGVVVVGRRPAGCPRAYCGCGTSLYVFGQNRRDLWQARAWYRFPRIAARVGAVAVRPHHVLVIIGGSPGAWLVHDSNSGGGLTRRHVTDLRGYTFVDPHASRYASN